MEQGQFHLIYPDGRYALFFDPNATISEVMEFVSIYNRNKAPNAQIVEILSSEGVKKLTSMTTERFHEVHSTIFA